MKTYPKAQLTAALNSLNKLSVSTQSTTFAQTSASSLHNLAVLAKKAFETGFWCQNKTKPYVTKSLQFKCKFNSFDILKLVWFSRGQETHITTIYWLYVTTFINPCKSFKRCHIFGKGSTKWIMEWAGEKARQWSELGPIMSRKKCNRSHRKCKE